MKDSHAQLESGSTLLLSIIVLAGVMSISLAIGALTVRELKTTSEQTRSTNALYAADAGMERGIFEYHLNGITTGSFSSSLTNGSNYTVTLSKETKAVASLHQDKIRQFDLFGNYIQGIIMTWGIPQDASYNTTGKPPQMHYKLISFPQGGSIEDKDIEVKEGLCDFACGQLGWKIPIDTSNPGKDHVLRIKPLHNGADFEVAASGGSGTLEVVKVVSAGEFGLAKRALEAEITPGRAASGIWDYVLFSGSDL